MATNAEIAARLLRDAAGFFRSVGEQNPPLKEHMSHNAQAFEVMADRVEPAPTGEAPFGHPAAGATRAQQGSLSISSACSRGASAPRSPCSIPRRRACISVALSGW